MNTITIVFSTKKNSLISRLICWFTSWRHSHVALVAPDGQTIIESTGMRFPDPQTGEWRDGVREVPIAYVFQRDMVEFREIEHPYPMLVWEHAKKIVEQKLAYDHEYFGAWLLRKGKGDEHKITCNELIEICAARAGKALFPPDMRHTTPRDLYLISKEIEKC